MRYLLLNYSENPIVLNELPDIQYDYQSNLNVLKSSKKPAIGILENLSTETFTKIFNEGNDADSEMNFLLATESMTLVNTESSDPDSNDYALLSSLITMTNTQYQVESTDKD